jgi:acetylornithine deacetylase/succinyl-diaminopimelate desuccinylase-like protein
VLAAFRERLEQRFSTDLERIRDYLRMPSVSATGEGIREVAAATVGWIQDAGGTAELRETPGHPLIVGELAGPPGAPRLLRYGMYDVQPAEEADWISPPFAAEIHDLDGVGPAVVARGSANSKGTLSSLLVAAEILQELRALPVSIALLIEGEEELGSPHLAEATAAHRDDLSAEAAFDMDLMEDRSGKATLVTGCKGLLSMEIAVAGGDWGGPRVPLHSSEQAWIASPAWALVHALASLTDPEERIAVAGLRDDVTPPTEEDEIALKRLAETFDPQGHLVEAAASRFRLDGNATDLLRALMFEPTLNIDGMIGGYTGPGGKTIIPSEARAEVDIRLVPNMDPERTAAAVRRHLDQHGFAHVTSRTLEGYAWAKADPDNPVARALEASCQHLGATVMSYPLAPWCAPYFLFDRVLGLAWAAGGVGHAHGAHGPNEYASVEGLKRHIVGVAAFLLAYAAGRSGGR